MYESNTSCRSVKLTIFFLVMKPNKTPIEEYLPYFNFKKYIYLVQHSFLKFKLSHPMLDEVNIYVNLVSIRRS